MLGAARLRAFRGKWGSELSALRAARLGQTEAREHANDLAKHLEIQPIGATFFIRRGRFKPHAFSPFLPAERPERRAGRHERRAGRHERPPLPMRQVHRTAANAMRRTRAARRKARQVYLSTRKGTREDAKGGPLGSDRYAGEPRLCTGSLLPCTARVLPACLSGGNARLSYAKAWRFVPSRTPLCVKCPAAHSGRRAFRSESLNGSTAPAHASDQRHQPLRDRDKPFRPKG